MAIGGACLGGRTLVYFLGGAGWCRCECDCLVARRHVREDGTGAATPGQQAIQWEAVRANEKVCGGWHLQMAGYLGNAHLHGARRGSRAWEATGRSEMEGNASLGVRSWSGFKMRLPSRLPQKPGMNVMELGSRWPPSCVLTPAPTKIRRAKQLHARLPHQLCGGERKHRPRLTAAKLPSQQGWRWDRQTFLR